MLPEFISSHISNDTLDLSKMNLTDNDLLSLVNLLAEFKHLRTPILNLSHNPITTYSAFLLSQMLKWNNKIKQLFLTDTAIDDTGVRSFLDALQLHHSLIILELPDHIRPDFKIELKALLAHNL